MRRYTQGLFLLMAILIGCLTAGCGGAVQSAISSLAPSRSVSTTSGQTTITPTPDTSTPTPVTTTPSAPTPVTTTVTVQPSTQAATPSATTATPTGSAAASGGSGTSLLWLWILLGALAVAGVIVLIVRSSGRRSAAAADWQSRVIDAYAKGSALYDAMSVAETPAALAAADAGARWSDIQRRADDLAQTLYALREAAPDEDTRAWASPDTLASLQARTLRAGRRTRSGGAGPLHAQVVRDRMYAFEMALRALRSSGEPLS